MSIEHFRSELSNSDYCQNNIEINKLRNSIGHLRSYGTSLQTKLKKRTVSFLNIIVHSS